MSLSISEANRNPKRGNRSEIALGAQGGHQRLDNDALPRQ